MMRRVFLLGMIALGLYANGQHLLVAPDVRWDDEIHTYIGVVNPDEPVAAYTVTAYLADGTEAGSSSGTLQGHQQWFFSPAEHFDQTMVASVIFTSDQALVGFMAFDHQDGNRYSVAQMSIRPGDQLFIPSLHLGMEDVDTSFGLTNTDGSDGLVYSQPYFYEELTDRFVQNSAVASIPGIEVGHGQARFSYSDLYPNQENIFAWDQLQGSQSQPLVGVAHLIDDSRTHARQASVMLDRAPVQDLILSHLPGDQDTFWSSLVLINPEDGARPLEVTTYGRDGTIFQQFRDDLAPLERKTIFLNAESGWDIQPDVAWLRLTSNAGGIYGYAVFGRQDRTSMAALEPAGVPGNRVILPYVPTSSRFWSGFGVVNTEGVRRNVRIHGYNAAGERLFAEEVLWLEPYQKKVFSADALFGELAGAIDWVKIYAPGGMVTGFALVADRQGQFMAGVQGQTVDIGVDGGFQEYFEHDNVETMEDQGWHFLRFESFMARYVRSRHMTVRYQEPSEGISHYAYDPEFSAFWPTNKAWDDHSAFLSPMVEVPQTQGSVYLNFQMRIGEIEKAVNGCRLGLVYHVEGDDEWHWAGLGGQSIYAPRPAVFGTLTTIFWQGEPIGATGWLPFQVKLPDDAKGKRIEFGPYYFFPHAKQPSFLSAVFTAPLLLMDEVELTQVEKTNVVWMDPNHDKGTFTWSEEE